MNVPGTSCKRAEAATPACPRKCLYFPFFSMFQMPKNLLCGIPRQPREGDCDSFFSSCPLTWKKAFPPSRSVRGEAHDQTGALGCHYQETCPTVPAISAWLCQSVMPLAAENPTLLLLLLLQRAAPVPRQGLPRAAAAGHSVRSRSKDKHASKQNHVVFKTPFQTAVNQSPRTE